MRRYCAARPRLPAWLITSRALGILASCSSHYGLGLPTSATSSATTGTTRASANADRLNPDRCENLAVAVGPRLAIEIARAGDDR